MLANSRARWPLICRLKGGVVLLAAVSFRRAPTNSSAKPNPTRQRPKMEESRADAPVGRAPYEYRALSETDFTRIIVLHPSQQRDAQLRCDIVHCESQDFECEAISYAWGPPNFTATVLCDSDEAELRITPSLESALRAFRHESKPRRLWADAMCINQNDPVEKIRQVHRMSEIYKLVTGVLVWLGEDYDGGERALRWVEQHRDDLLCLFWELENDRRKPARLPERNVEGALDTVKRDFGEEDCLALVSLLSRPWFQRRWIIQEIAFARQGSVHCGTVSVDAGNFIRSASILCFLFQEAYAIPPATRKFLENLIPIQADAEAIPLVVLLYCFEASRCRDDRDRVYALMGLADDVSRLPSNAGHLGLGGLGYTSEVEPIYQVVAERVLADEQFHFSVVLEMAACFPPRDVPGSKLPSWVADWRSPKRSSRAWVDKPESSEEDSLPAWQLMGNVLRVQGRRLGTVSTGARSQEPPEEAKSSAEKLVLWWKSYGGMVGGAAHKAAADSGPNPEGWRRFFNCATKGVVETLDYDKSYRLLFPSNPTQFVKSPLSHSILVDYLNRVIPRRLLFPTDNSFVVNGPDDTEAGDVVVQLQIGHQCILRPVQEAARYDHSEGEYFQFIGDAFVDQLPDSVGLGGENFKDLTPCWFAIV